MADVVDVVDVVGVVGVVDAEGVEGVADVISGELFWLLFGPLVLLYFLKIERHRNFRKELLQIRWYKFIW